ncbi:BlaI/MecI/CopY family transcriptional regulator [Acetatifactor muris]|uniref:BlaI/MecI/CopY family transcriptional regulator n=1 Tax=Acetatifactor muris TaxID=879566 RepID=UPI0023F23753|nr:BlaI/MecI/CopY family transcriptional regulator [Acetatifactor muris]
MEDVKLGVVETKFADIIWRQEPLSSGELVTICREELSWKKSTTYTVLKKLCDKGIFQNQEGRITSLISRQDFYAARSTKFVEDTFDGSLPAFIAAFTSRKSLSREEIAEIRDMIDSSGGADHQPGNRK